MVVLTESQKRVGILRDYTPTSSNRLLKLLVMVVLTEAQKSVGHIRDYTPTTANRLLSLPELYCSDREGNSSLISARSLSGDVKPYLRSCWDVDKVVGCILETREDPAYTVDDWSPDRFFPREDDIKRAYYIFCIRYFGLVEGTFVTAVRPPQCDHSAIKTKCDKCINTRAAGLMKRAIDEHEVQLASVYACDMMINSVLCRQREYKRCYQHWDPIMDFELIKLGPDCLERHQIASSITVTKCTDQTASASSSKSSWTLAAVFLSAILTF